MEPHLEVVVTKLRTRYQAVCPLFPLCKGVGATEEKALIQLGRSIAKMIGEASEKNLTQLFSSHRYTEVILDATKATKEQRRVFRLDGGALPGFQLQYKSQSPMDILLKPTQKQDQDITKLLDYLDEMLVSNGMDFYSGDSDHPFTSAVMSRLQEEVSGFGFPLSMN